MATRRRLLTSRAWLVVVGFAVFAYLFHDFGNTRGYYVRFWWFQVAAHYVSASALALLLVRSGLAAGLCGRRLAAFVLVAGTAGALTWELVEYLAIFPNLHFWGVDDMLIDLVADAAGFATVFVLFRSRFRPVVDPTVETPALAEALQRD